ncbi:MAG: exodeoxyribonuclease III, partial [Pseudomonadota bacterium]
KSDARHTAVSFEGGITLHNFYVPAGGDLPDPDLNEKFAHKLAFLEEAAAWFQTIEGGEKARHVLVGDLNVAPLEHDVWSHKQLLKVVSHTPIEVSRLETLQASAGWIDVTREAIPEPEKVFTWWSYRSPDWKKSDRGRRLDHIWVTPALAPAVRSVSLQKETRSWKQPSDHIPVMVDLAAGT